MTPLVFDLDGTLIDSLGTITRAANGLLAGRGLDAISARQAAGYVGFGEQVFIDRLIADTALEADDRGRLLAEFVEIYVAVSRETVLFAGVLEMLDGFAARGVPLGLCTNKPGRPLASVLETTGLSGYFGSVFAGDTLALRKPDPAPLLACFEALGGRGIYVGDSPVDAQTAQAAGVPFVIYTEGIRTVPLSEIPHDVAFSDMAELAGIYASLGR